MAAKTIGVSPVSLPKGGGAIKGIGETFQPNEFTGTAALSIPIPTPPCRNFEPQLKLDYSSGSGNGIFGLGFSLSISTISRKTSKGIPQYAGADTFILSGAEDLVPVIEEQSSSVEPYTVTAYRPRTEGLFAKIEQWTDQQTGLSYWRVVSKENITSLYGATEGARITDPDNPTHIFQWLLQETFDSKGNHIVYEYKPEDSLNLSSDLYEANRTQTANKYISRIQYGNDRPIQGPIFPADPGSTQWHFEIVFDYGEYNIDPGNPSPYTPVQSWLNRADSFSTYHAGFEIRTHRLCRNILTFHNFKELGDQPMLVHATRLQYEESPVVTRLQSVTPVGYRKQATSNTYVTVSLPPILFGYIPFVPAGHAFTPFLEKEAQFLPGLVGSNYMLIDLYGEGVPGVLYSDGATILFAEAQSSPGDSQSDPAAPEPPMRYGPLREPRTFPIVRDVLSASNRLIDLTGDGQLDLVVTSPAGTGFYEAHADASWHTSRMLPRCPVDFDDPDSQLLDVTGDGLVDILRIEHERVVLYQGLGQDGFRAPQARLREPGLPWLERDTHNEVVRFADMFGSGGQHLVRITDGRVECWPHFGYGRFGKPVLFDNAPRFAGGFDAARLFLADLDGSGTADLIFVFADHVAIWFNQSGNSFSAEPLQIALPGPWDELDQISFADVRGNGTTCLIFSETHPQPREWCYDFCQGTKPYLLAQIDNNLGARSTITYASSTQFYLADKAAGTPWITNLPFPVQVVERIQVDDLISDTTLVSTFTYHHGYYDGVEREFRGFGRVDRYDAEQFDVQAAEPTFNVPPVLTRTWYHTGVYFGGQRVSNYFAGLDGTKSAGEYFREPGLTDAQAQQLLLDDTPLPPGLTGEEEREACCALKGSMLREEVYALDGTPKAQFPYSVTEQNHTVEVVQPKADNLYAVFFTHPREVLTYHYERNPADPRISHALTLEVDAFANVLKSLAIAYGRRHASSNPVLTDGDKAKQAQLLITYVENDFTNPVLTDDAHLGPLPADTRTYELTGFRPDNSAARFSFDEWTRDGFALLSNAPEIQYEQAPDGVTPQKRLIERVRTYYRPDDLGTSNNNDPLTLLPLKQVQSLALHGESYRLAFTPGLLNQVYVRAGQTLLPSNPADVLAGGGADGGGYVDVDGDGHWWMPSGRTFLSPNRDDTATQELAYAGQHFFLPHRTRDPFDTSAAPTETFTDYDEYDLLVQQSRDALGNVVAAVNDYRVLEPQLVTDPNSNRTAVAFDALGMVVATAVMGKSGESIGDLLEGFDPDPPLADLQAFMADPLSTAATMLGKATTRFVYDPGCYQRASQPTYAATLARETHASDPPPSQGLQIQIGFAYADGFGRVAQMKSRAEPGDAPLRAANVRLPSGDAGPGPLKLNNGLPVFSPANPRWVGTGRTVFNNKGKPVKQYEPFFSATHLYEAEREMTETGVTPILFYDPVERVVATLHPNHTYEKVVFDPWRQETWDANDTVTLSDPKTDPEVGDYFRPLPAADYLPTWYDQRANGQLGADEQAAAIKAAAHAATPGVTHFDVLARPMMTVADNGKDASGADQKYVTRVTLDIQGNQRELIDANGRLAMHDEYDLLGNRIHEASMDTGEHWQLNDVAGKPIRAWDSRNAAFRSAYDALRRPTQSFVTEAASPEVLAVRTVYGESQPNPQASNLRGQVSQAFDQAGVTTHQAYDFKGNLLDSTRQLVADYRAAVDWSQDLLPLRDTDTYASSTRYDALNRPVQMVAPHSDRAGAGGSAINVIQPGYNAGGLLARVDVWLAQTAEPGALLDPAAANLHAITAIEYDAKSQRQRIDYGNGASTLYEYDPLTWRLTHLLTQRNAVAFPGDCPQSPPTDWPGCQVQNLHYTYDPVGNITEIRDDAQQTIYFKNQRVEPSAAYTYDAIYRLLEASGREHLGQAGSGVLPPAPSSDTDAPRVGLLQPGDGKALGTYLETYTYEPAGNILSVQHRGSDPAQPGWTRAFTYNEPSLLEPGKTNNRLTSTQIGTGPAETYAYDAHGNMTGMPHLPLMQWDYLNQLQSTAQQVVNAGTPETTYYVYDASGQRMRQVTDRQAGAGQIGVRKAERIYLGGFEIYREYANDGTTISLERETLHVMDDQQRVALVETRTQGSDPSPQQLIRYQFSNQLDSAMLELDDQAHIISYEEYTPFGSTSYQAVRSQTETPKRYRYAGKERDDATGLYYYGARYYAPWLGRWTSPDPGGMVDGPNLYAFVSGNPLSYSDPLGLCKKKKKSKKSTTPPTKIKAPKAKKKAKAAAVSVDVDPANPYRWEGNVWHPGSVTATSADPHLQAALNSYGRPTHHLVKLYEDLGNRIGADIKKNKGKLQPTTEADLQLAIDATRPLHFNFNQFLHDEWTVPLTSYGGAKTGAPLYTHNRGNLTTSFSNVKLDDNSILNAHLQVTGSAAHGPRKFEVHHLFYKSIHPDIATHPGNLMLVSRSQKESVFGPYQHELMHMVASGGDADKFDVLTRPFVDTYQDWAITEPGIVSLWKAK